MDAATRIRATLYFWDMMDSGASPIQAPEPPAIPETGRGAFGSALGTTATTAAGPGGERVSSFSLSAWAVARYTLVIALTLAGLFLLWKIQEVVLLLLLAIIFATVIEPLVNRLRRGPFSRGQGILLVYSALFLAVALIGTLFVP